jgi:GAF domain-containing protein
VGMVSTPPSASFFAQISQDLMRFGEERPTLQTVVERAVEVVPACDAASVTLRRRRNRTETVAASSDIARQADQLQYDLNEGPCLEAAVTGEPRMSNHLADCEDWPRWGPRAAEIGIHALLGIQLSTDDEVLGALNLYSAKPDTFTRHDIDVAEIYATHATNALTAARLSSGLRTALHTRHMIGVAQGILMQIYELSMDQSFELLRRYSSHTNTKLGDVAEYVVTHRRLPENGARG